MPNYYNNPYYPAQPNVYPTQTTQNTQQIQNGGFVPAPNEEFARNYPVAIGTSVTFKDESAPYIYTKTMGFSQLDRPIFEKYKLVKEEVSDPRKDNPIDSIKSDIDKIWGELNAIKEARKNTPKRESKIGES